ncbi:lysozyme [Shinella curvata]|uniref:Lysozyme n=1 Tax=Shinella curvata TaxID=1817964 RepID=A0ABT8XJ07_9HYPH|nr:lysozyme [Shinella curvata]MCJ8053914.1 lysozyme [Shinella curvata]MDO6123246.1 lysozyme [Shinella curvata]
MTTTLQVQERLIALGYYVGPKGADGDYGPGTIGGILSALEDLERLLSAEKKGSNVFRQDAQPLDTPELPLRVGDLWIAPSRGNRTKQWDGASWADFPSIVEAPAQSGLTTSPSGRKALTQREGNVLTAYQDSIGIWTIGVGHTSAAGLPSVAKGLKITAAESDEILSRDLKTFEAGVRAAVKVPLNQNEFDALVSLAFNIGVGAFSKSTLVKKLNAGDRAGAADQFLVWNKAGGKTLKGLTTRRQAERKQFLS